MRLYLSSYRLGNHSDKLLSLLKGGGRVAIISNAVDHIPADARQDYLANIYNSREVFEQMGFTPSEIDLRHYFGRQEALKQELRKHDLIWVQGGNVFLLRRAMKYSGFDTVVKELLAQDTFVYSGDSAGVCVLAPTLKGVELCDKADEICDGYEPDVIWDGLGLVNFSIAPHYRSEHPETEMIENVVAYFEAHNMPYKPLRDGDVLVDDGNGLKLYKREDGKPNILNLDKNKRNESADRHAR